MKRFNTVGWRIGAIGRTMLALALTGAAAANAAPPERFTIPFFDSFNIVECDGFDVDTEGSGWVTVTDFYDNDGERLHRTVHLKLQARVFNTVTGFEQFSNVVINNRIDPDFTELFIRGMALNVTVPGYGMVIFDAGLGVFVVEDGQFIEVKFAGKVQADEDLICLAMDQ